MSGAIRDSSGGALEVPRRRRWSRRVAGARSTVRGARTARTSGVGWAPPRRGAALAHKPTGPAVVAVGAWREPQPPTARVPAARRSHGRIQRNRPTSDLGEAWDLASAPQSAALSSGPRRAPEPLRRSSCGLEGRRARIERPAAAICYRALRLCKLLSCRFLAVCGGRPSVGATAKLTLNLEITTPCYTVFELRRSRDFGSSRIQGVIAVR